MIRVHETIITPIEGSQTVVTRWFKTTPFSNLLSKLESIDLEALGRGDTVTIMTLWMSESDVDTFASVNDIVWND